MLAPEAWIPTRRKLINSIRAGVCRKGLLLGHGSGNLQAGEGKRRRGELSLQGQAGGLYSEVLNQCARAAHVEQMRVALDQTGKPEDILRDVVQARVQGLRTDAFPNWYLRIFAHELTEPTPAMSRLIKTVSRPIYERLMELISKIIGLPAGHDKTRLCAHSIMGQILFYVFAAPASIAAFLPI